MDKRPSQIYFEQAPASGKTGIKRNKFHHTKYFLRDENIIAA
jgi:hypothetical protein